MSLIIDKKETLVLVRLVIDDQTNEVSVEVSIRSNGKIAVWNHSKTTADEEATLDYRVQKIAEALAEFQNLNYGDIHNTQSVGQSALAAMRDIKKVAEKAKKSSIGPEAGKKATE